MTLRRCLGIFRLPNRALVVLAIVGLISLIPIQASQASTSLARVSRHQSSRHLKIALAKNYATTSAHHQAKYGLLYTHATSTQPPPCFQAISISGQLICSLSVPQGPTLDPPTTWSTIYTSATPGSGFFNISCIDVNDCISTGEAGASSTTGTPLVAITHNGGSTWVEHQF